MDNYSVSRYPALPGTHRAEMRPPPVPPRDLPTTPPPIMNRDYNPYTDDRIQYQLRPGFGSDEGENFTVDEGTSQSPRRWSRQDGALQVQNDGAGVGFEDGTVISDQPLMSPAMSFSGLPPPSVTTLLPNVRGSNLSKLTKGAPSPEMTALPCVFMKLFEVYYRMCKAITLVRILDF